jgi:hypothetical protein
LNCLYVHTQSVHGITSQWQSSIGAFNSRPLKIKRTHVRRVMYLGGTVPVVAQTSLMSPEQEMSPGHESPGDTDAPTHSLAACLRPSPVAQGARTGRGERTRSGNPGKSHKVSAPRVELRILPPPLQIRLNRNRGSGEPRSSSRSGGTASERLARWCRLIRTKGNGCLTSQRCFHHL